MVHGKHHVSRLRVSWTARTASLLSVADCARVNVTSCVIGWLRDFQRDPRLRYSNISLRISDLILLRSQLGRSNSKVTVTTHPIQFHRRNDNSNFTVTFQ